MICIRGSSLSFVAGYKSRQDRWITAGRNAIQECGAKDWEGRKLKRKMTGHQKRDGRVTRLAGRRDKDS